MGRVLGAMIGLNLVLASFAWAEPTEQVYSALAQQDAWLTQSPHGVTWQDYLMTNELRDALAAPTLDRRVLASVLGRYNSNAPGLTEGPFVTTKNALTSLANQARVPMALRWAEQIQAASPHQKPFSKQALLDAKYEVIDAKSALDQFLNHADYETQNGWNTFLQTDILEEQLKADTPDWKQLDQVQLQFRDGYPGLEYPAFHRLRKALQKYSFIGKLSESDKTKATIDQYSTALAKALEKYNGEPTTKNAGRVAAILDWLRTIDRDVNLAQEVRERHNLPNVHLRLSEAFLQRRFHRDVNESMYVNEMILKTHVRGTATTRGQVTADVIRNPHVAQVDIVFNGNTDTVSVGRQKPVTIRSRSATHLQARKPLFIYPTRIAAQSAVARGSTNTQIQSITPDRRLGRRIIGKVAWKQAGQQKPRSEAIAAERAARRLEKKLDDQSMDLVSRAQQALSQQLNGPLNQRGLIPESIRTSSQDAAVHVHATQANDAQLAATTSPPFHAPDAAVVAQLHESAVNNTVEKAIAGMTLTDEGIVDLMKELNLEIPEELQITEDDAPWSMSFDWNQPVTVEFDDQELTVSVRGRQFTRGETTLNKVMEISATYTMQTLHQGVVLTRQGDINVSFPGNPSVRTSDIVFKTLMEKKFSQLFKPVIQGDGFTLPGRFGELGVIRLDSLSTEDGWLSFGWK